MADQLATLADLAAHLQVGEADLNPATGTLLIECATAVVQAAAGQRIVEATSTVTLESGPDRWLWLPQIPVRSVTSVVLDGTALTADDGYRLRGHRLWRAAGWQTCASPPSEVVVEYTHGYPADAQELQLARQAVLSLAAAAYRNPGGAVREQIDDYAVAYEAVSTRMEAAPYLRTSLRRQYGRSAGLITLGG
ncbi:hypothetical protein ACQSSU_06635 [Micromonospora echinospora]